MPKKIGKTNGWNYGQGSKDYKVGPRCYESHPPLKLPSSDLVIYGGSCLSPVVDDADVYIGFQKGMKTDRKAFPWTEGFVVPFPITDMQAPSNAKDFVDLVKWTRQKLEEGLKVHAGCIGGHGRTGTFLSALVSTYGVEDATAYVRKHYCKKAVESKAQVEFLKKHFGVTPSAPTKNYGSLAGGKKESTTSIAGWGKSQDVSYDTERHETAKDMVFDPMPDRGSIW